jgi:MFS family permease
LPDGGAQHYAQSEVRKVTVSSLLGTMIEYYDFFLYTTMAGLVFGKLFFPVANSVVSTIAAFGTVAVGYIARPLGGLVFGHFGDKIGRKSMLMVTMGLMGMASALIGTLPTYSAIGITAPILLVFLRVVQGLAVGGEWGGAALMVVERSDPRRRGFWSGLMLLGTPLALFLSTGVVDVVNNLYVRHKVSESPVFKQARGGADQSRKTPVIQLLRRPRPLVLAAAVGIASQLFSALMQTHIFAYAPSVGFDKADVLKALLFESCVSIAPSRCSLPSLIDWGDARCFWRGRSDRSSSPSLSTPW